jgi:hypothetical protein
MSLKDALRKAVEAGASNLPRETVQTPELAEYGLTEITLQGMTGKQRDAWEGSLIVQKGNGKRRVNTANVRARLVVASAIEPDGSRAFTDEDAGWVGNLRVDVLTRLYEAAQRLSGVSDEDVDELGKSSAAADGSASSSI